MSTGDSSKHEWTRRRSNLSDKTNQKAKQSKQKPNKAAQHSPFSSLAAATDAANSLSNNICPEIISVKTSSAKEDTSTSSRSLQMLPKRKIGQFCSDFQVEHSENKFIFIRAKANRRPMCIV